MKIISWAVTIVYAGFIFYLSSKTWQSVPSFPLSDKVFHLILYMGFGIALLFSLYATRLKDRRRFLYIVFACAMFYGLIDEIHQLFVPGRHFDLADLVADAVGSVIGIFLAAKFLKATKTSKKVDIC